jgi:hypothetical protein
VDMDWENGVLSNLTIHSDKNNNTIIRYKDKLVEIEFKKGESRHSGGKIIEL